MAKVKFPIVSVVLYVLAVMMALYTAWAARNSIQIVSEAVAQNQLVISGNEFEVASFYMSNFAQYGLYAVILFSLGWIVQGVAGNAVDEYELEELDELEEIEEEENREEDLEDLFEDKDG